MRYWPEKIRRSRWRPKDLDWKLRRQKRLEIDEMMIGGDDER